MRFLQAILVCLFAMACGPTAQVITSPSPISSPSGLPTVGPTLPPTYSTTAGPTGSATPIPIPTDTPAPGATTPGPTTPPTGTGFQPLAGFASTAAFEVDDVIATPGGFMAVGFGGLDGETYFGRHQGVVWTSADGLNWTESVDASLRNVSPYQVVVRGVDYFMAGVVSACPQLSEEECTDVPEAGSAIFHSTDGVAWQMLPQNVDMQYGLIDDMLFAGDRLVVFGSSADENQTTTVWQSTDGATWSSSTNLAGLETISAMTFGNNLLTAFGTRYVPELEDIVLMAASSVDGATFTAATVPDLTGAAIDDVVQGTNGFAGVGYQSSEALEIAGVALFSADGTTWTEVTNSDASWAGSGVSFIGALPAGGYVAVAFTPREDDFTLQDGTTLRSADGTDWTSLGSLDGAFSQLMSAALGGPGMVVFAVEYTEDDEGENVTTVVHGWFAPLSELGG
ncbi:MAG: hypothetical protein ABI797_04730 [Chloroflexota bacterium]